MAKTIKIGSVECLTNEYAQEAIGRRYDALQYCTADGTHKNAFVCTFCDKYLMHTADVNIVSLSAVEREQRMFHWNEYPHQRHAAEGIREYYRFNDVSGAFVDESHFIYSLSLSPRGLFVRDYKCKRKRLSGFTSCEKCKCDITAGVLPYFSIPNNNYCGAPPQCIKDLSETEIAFLSPLRAHGMSITYKGGGGMSMKGSLTLMRMNERDMSGAAAQFEAMGFNRNMVIILSGSFTVLQKEKARKRVEINTERIIKATRWLCSNHAKWQSVKFDELVTTLEDSIPQVVENTKMSESTNENIETQESFMCYYPDGNANDSTGGMGSVEEFKTFVKEKQEAGADVLLQMKVEAKFDRDFSRDVLVDACLMNFPYGICGFKERRLKRDMRIEESNLRSVYVQHLAEKSDPEFQRHLLPLVCFSMICREQILYNSRLQVRSDYKAKTVVDGINSRDLAAAVKGRKKGNWKAGTAASSILLDAVNGVSRALPHSESAAKKALCQAQAMQHHKGLPAIFLTLTFCDDQGFFMQVLTREMVDDGTEPCELNDDEHEKRQKARTVLRLEFPGVTSIHFEMMFHIIMEEVIGWSFRENQPTGKPGLYGVPEAVTAAFEEQGRKTVHTHLSLWIKTFGEMRAKLQAPARQQDVRAKVQEKTMTLMKEYANHVMTTKLFPKERNDKRKAFNHSCSASLAERESMMIVDNQGLRDLRHALGHEITDGAYAQCPTCSATFTVDDLVAMLAYSEGVFDSTLNALPFEEQLKKKPTARMHSIIAKYQMTKNCNDIPSAVINMCYNCHAGKHVKSCFKCMKGAKKGHRHGPSCECRYNLPDITRTFATVSELLKSERWFNWDGTKSPFTIYSCKPERTKFNNFQNVSCRAVSESKVACNTNCAVQYYGPIAQYQFKYHMKSTREDDRSGYSEVEKSIRTLSDTRSHEDDRKECMRLIARASFAHSKSDIVGVPLASFLNRHHSRFLLSEQFAYVPLSDLRVILDGGTVGGSLQFDEDGNYLKTLAYNYLCRNPALEKLSLKLFIEQFRDVRCPVKTKKRKKKSSALQEVLGVEQNVYIDPEEILPYVNTEGWTHTSTNEENIPAMGSKLRDEVFLCQVHQYNFCDTELFRADLFHCEEDKINEYMERYAQCVLILFQPFRTLDDLKPIAPNTRRPFVERLRELKFDTDNKYSECRTFLQNVQECAYNCTRESVHDNELSENTTALDPAEYTVDRKGDCEDDVEEDDGPSFDLSAVLEHLNDSVVNDPDANDPDRLWTFMAGFTMEKIRDVGRNFTGYDKYMPEANLTVTTPLIGPTVPTNRTSTGTASSPQYNSYENPLPRLLLQVLVRISVPRTRGHIFRDESAVAPDANGSVKSMVAWSEAAGLDALQQRAFMCICAAFLLTFYVSDPDGVGRVYSLTRNALIELVGAKNKATQLLMLLHGPGGSGKTTVINLVVAYGRNYCELVSVPFTTETIVLTASTGVAATYLHGDTIHSRASLMQTKNPLTEDQKNAWTETRLLIVDEISMLLPASIFKLEQNLRELKRQHFKIYGGLSIVFLGDYSQLAPIGTSIYDEPNDNYYQPNLNCFLELNGMHRFRNDLEWGERLMRIRMGRPTLEDIETINEECCVSDIRRPPPNVQVAVHENSNRDAINAAIFDKFCVNNADENGHVGLAAMVLMDDLMMAEKGQKVPVVSNRVKRVFYETATESGIASTTNSEHTPRVDPCLKLYPGCPMMITKNIDVANGKANGTRLFMQTIVPKVGERPMVVLMDNNFTVHSFTARQIDHIVLRHENPDIHPNTTTLTPDTFHFFCDLPFSEGLRSLRTAMSGLQFPLTSNSATTGHKLQGYTATHLYVAQTNNKPTWIYTALSRVKEMANLYLKHKLSLDLTSYEMSAAMTGMIQRFQNTIGIRDVQLPIMLHKESQYFTRTDR